MAARRIVIAGAGVAGLATALAVRRAGDHASVLERAKAAPSQGGVLLLWANAIKALRALGLGDEVIAAGTVVDHVEFRSFEGEPLLDLPMQKLRDRYGAPAIMLSRPELIRMLADAAGRSSIQWGQPVTGFRTRGQEVLVDTRDGAAPPADGLIGADGMRSVIREGLFGREPLRSAYHVAWIGTALTTESDWPYPSGQTIGFLGGGLRFCAATLRSQPGDAPGLRRVSWYATEKVSIFDRDETPIERRELAELFHKAHGPLGSLIDSTPSVWPFPIFDLPPRSRWSRGRVTITGDAAHPCTPDIGQGACQALESAVALGRALSKSDIPGAFRAFQRSRQARAAHVTKLARQTAIQSMAEGPGVEQIRNRAIKALMPSITALEFHFLFSPDP